MDISLNQLSPYMNLELCDDVDHSSHIHPSSNPIYTASAALPNNKKITLLKSVLSSSCENNCYYCPFRAGRDFPRYSFSPEAFAKLFMNLFKAGIVEGLFISSGIINNGITTQDKLLAAAEILRQRYDFQGYIHIKLMPGCEKSQVEQAIKLANRVSINLEAPNKERLKQLAPNKQFFEDLLLPLQWAQEIRSFVATKNLLKPSPSISFTTQFVVGASEESDLELLTTTNTLFKQYGISRAYYSPFRPYPDTPLENHPPTSLLRQKRLYQASFLIRDYNYTLSELIFDNSQNLPLSKDPKVIWANKFILHSPIEINSSDPQILIRIPGIGKKGVKAILAARKQRTLTDLSMLAKLGINIHRAAPYVLLNGKRQNYQLSLW